MDQAGQVGSSLLIFILVVLASRAQAHRALRGFPQHVGIPTRFRNVPEHDETIR